MITFTPHDKRLGRQIYKKLNAARKKNLELRIANFSDIRNILNKDERAVVDKIRYINPQDYEKKYQLLGIRPVPSNLVRIKDQTYQLKEKNKKIPLQFLPKKVFKAYQKLNNAMQQDIDRSINVFSGYRSPAYQMVLFFCDFYNNLWDVNKTLVTNAPPAYSEHCYPARQAIDFAPAKGIPELTGFHRTKEYRWLERNASKFNFYLSYPKYNGTGVVFEPWHWHFEVKRI